MLNLVNGQVDWKGANYRVGLSFSCIKHFRKILGICFELNVHSQKKTKDILWVLFTWMMHGLWMMVFKKSKTTLRVTEDSMMWMNKFVICTIGLHSVLLQWKCDVPRVCISVQTHSPFDFILCDKDSFPISWYL